MDPISSIDELDRMEFAELKEPSYEKRQKTGYSHLDSIGSTPWWLLGIGGLVVGGGVYAAKRRSRQKGESCAGAQESTGSDSSNMADYSSQSMQADSYNGLHPSMHGLFTDPGSSTQIPSFSDIICSKEDQEKIADIVTTLDKNSFWGLISEKGRLERLGQKIDLVHSLTFLWSIFRDDRLKEGVRRIFTNPSKTFHQMGFMGGVNKGLSRYRPELLDPYLFEWAQALGTTKEAVKPLIDAPFNSGKDWTVLVLHLLSVKKSP